MELAILLTIISIIIAIVIGGWQSYLAWKQIQISKLEKGSVSQHQETTTASHEYRAQP